MQEKNQLLPASVITDTLTLFCLVDGESMSKAFPLSASPTDTVGQLKNLIKEKSTPRFDDIPANELALWSVSIPVIAAKKHDPVIIDSLETKDELLPTTRLSKLYPKGVEDDIIHILVQRPLSSDSEFSNHVTFKVIIQTDTRQDFAWSTDANTATVTELEQALYKAYPELEDGPANIGIQRGKAHGYPETKVEYPNDNGLGSILWINIKARIPNLKVVLEAPSKAFSKFTLKEINAKYNLTTTPTPTIKHMPAFTSMDTVSFDPDNYNQRWDRLCGILDDQRRSTTVVNEAGKSVFVYSFLSQAILLFENELTLIPERPIAGRWGHGPVDYAVESRKHATFMLGVTEVKHDTIEKGFAQNVAQLEASLTDKKRKVDDNVDETIQLVSYGIVTNSHEWYFVECTMHRTSESVLWQPSFRTSRVPAYVDFELDNWKEQAKIVFGYIIWLVERMLDQIPNRLKRPRAK
ncbi:hypothetical protein BGX26_002943 [Mortierella sp. AD094]|nr:hypothetical protein BGX26_002943 [Mortierella sp. AD094]